MGLVFCKHRENIYPLTFQTNFQEFNEQEFTVMSQEENLILLTILSLIIQLKQVMEAILICFPSPIIILICLFVLN